MHPLAAIVLTLLLLSLCVAACLGAKLLLDAGGILHTVQGRALQVMTILGAAWAFYRLWIRRVAQSCGHPSVQILMALLFIAAGSAASIGLKLVLESLGVLDTIPGRFLQTLSLIFFVTQAYRVYLRLFERRELTAYPLKGSGRRIALGLGMGAGLVAVQAAVLAAACGYRITAFEPSAEVVKYMFLMVTVGFIEELVTREVLFRLLEKWAGSILALAAVILEGALTHATNPNSTFWSSAAVGLEFGLMMCLVYMATRNLWTVSAMHFAWNFTMGGILDIAVSGTESQSLFRAVYQGPAILTGGEFGTEAGLPAVLLSAGLSLWLIVRLAGNREFRGRDAG